jgi:hypothetical protein
VDLGEGPSVTSPLFCARTQSARKRLIAESIGFHFSINDDRGSFVKPKAIIEFASNLLRYRFSPAEGKSPFDFSLRGEVN